MTEKNDYLEGKGYIEVTKKDGTPATTLQGASAAMRGKLHNTGLLFFDEFTKSFVTPKDNVINENFTDKIDFVHVAPLDLRDTIKTQEDLQKAYQDSGYDAPIGNEYNEILEKNKKQEDELKLLKEQMKVLSDLMKAQGAFNSSLQKHNEHVKSELEIFKEADRIKSEKESQRFFQTIEREKQDPNLQVSNLYVTPLGNETLISRWNEKFHKYEMFIEVVISINGKIFKYPCYHQPVAGRRIDSVRTGCKLMNVPVSVAELIADRYNVSFIYPSGHPRAGEDFLTLRNSISFSQMPSKSGYTPEQFDLAVTQYGMQLAL
jgi:hypothetical protein